MAANVPYYRPVRVNKVCLFVYFFFLYFIFYIKWTLKNNSKNVSDLSYTLFVSLIKMISVKLNEISASPKMPIIIIFYVLLLRFHW